MTEHLLRIGNWRNRPMTPVAVHLPYVLPTWEKESEGCVFHHTVTLPPGMAHLPITGENVHVWAATVET